MFARASGIKKDEENRRYRIPMTLNNSRITASTNKGKMQKSQISDSQTKLNNMETTNNGCHPLVDGFVSNVYCHI